MRRVLAVVLVLVAFASAALLRPSAVSYDGLAFVLAARAGSIDYGHALYLTLLHALSWTSLPPILGAQLLAAAGLGAACALLVRGWVRAGASPGQAALGTALFAASTLIWQEAGSIEPTTWTIAALLAAAELSARHAARPGAGRLALVGLAFLAAVGFHLVSLCALPWLARLARGARPFARRDALLPLAALGVLLGVGLAGGRLGEFVRYWSGFLPAEPAGGLGARAARGAAFLLEGAPVLALGGLGALFLARRGSREELWLALPYALAFVLLGKPLVGLLAPVVLAADLAVRRWAVGAAQGGRAAYAGPALGLAALLQLALALPQAWAGHRAPDVPRERAELLARYLPPGTVLFAGALTNHLRFYRPEVAVVSLPELLHDALARHRALDPIAVVQEEVRRTGKRCALSSDGAALLLEASADLSRLGVSLEGAFVVPEDPRLALFPLGEG